MKSVHQLNKPTTTDIEQAVTKGAIQNNTTKLAQNKHTKHQGPRDSVKDCSVRVGGRWPYPWNRDVSLPFKVGNQLRALLRLSNTHPSV